MRLIPLIQAVAFGVVLAVSGAEIPDRPEKLSFPPLTYEPPDPAQYRVPLKSGPVAYVVPDRTLPLVTVTLLVRCGNYLDPKGEEGLADFTGYLLARGGTARRTAEELDERMAFLAAQLSSGVGDDSGTVSLNLLSKDLPEGLAVLREVLTTPRFQAEKLDLYRQQSLQAMKQRNDDSASIQAREVETLAYGTNFWACRQTTAASLGSLTPDKLRAFHRRWFHPRNFVVAVSGDFEREAMVARLEELLGNWPFEGEAAPPIPGDIRMAAPGVYLVDKDVNQGRVTVLLPGVGRDDPDFPAVQVMNDILGGGGFTSRLMNRVRSDEGLAYGAYSAFPGGVHFPRAFQAGLETKSRTVAYAASIVLEEMKRIVANPVKEEELVTTRRQFVDSFPGNFNTKTKVATQFANDEFTGRFAREPDFWRKWRGRIEAVTADEIRRVAGKYLHPDRVAIFVVGQKAEILKGHPDHPVTLESLAGGRLTELPLRDPLTLEPLPKGTSSSSAPAN